jgi:predicted dehydrogenase
LEYKLKTRLAVWTRFFPIISSLQKLIHVDGAIGNISRVFVDFGLDMPISSLSPSSRTADPSLGAGALLDIGIYTLTWASIILDQHPDNSGTSIPSVASSMSFTSGADEMTSIILNYDKLKAQAICTASMRHKSAPEFCRIEGDKGTVSVGGVAASKPGFLAVRINGKEEEKIEFEAPGFGFYFEADAVAADLRNGRKENDIMPLQESLRLMKLMDHIRTQNGLRYKQDD